MWPVVTVLDRAALGSRAGSEFISHPKECSTVWKNRGCYLPVFFISVPSYPFLWVRMRSLAPTFYSWARPDDLLWPLKREWQWRIPSGWQPWRSGVCLSALPPLPQWWWTLVLVWRALTWKLPEILSQYLEDSGPIWLGWWLWFYSAPAFSQVAFSGFW